MRRPVLFMFAAALALGPAAAQQRQHYLSPQDVAEAQRENRALIQELGGAETGARADYVQSVGRRVGAYSGIADARQALHFTTLNSAVENAFSVPGGYVYITRQLMAIMGDESQLAFALGHEVGHIAANHAHQREEVARELAWRALPQILFGQMIGGGFGNAIAIRSELAAALQSLSFSREQEYEADQLGLKYITAAGYDPEGGPALLAELSRVTALETRIQGRSNRRIPEWASTHPLSENRAQRALSEARATGRLGSGVRNRDTFLNELEGIYVDDDPAQGIIDGPVFTHPDLRIQFRVPTGYLMSNGTDAVTISGSAGKAQFSGGAYSGSLDSAVFQIFRSLTGRDAPLAVPRPRHSVINGMPAAISTVHVTTDSGAIDASVAAYQWDSRRIYYFVMLTPGGSGIGAFTPMVSSLRRITPQEAAAIRPRVIHVVTVKAGDSVQSLARRMAYRDYQLDRFLTINGLTAGSRLTPGQRVKLVVYGSRRS
jgi:predicted Zn-dependent protease